MSGASSAQNHVCALNQAEYQLNPFVLHGGFTWAVQTSTRVLQLSMLPNPTSEKHVGPRETLTLALRFGACKKKLQQS